MAIPPVPKQLIDDLETIAKIPGLKEVVRLEKQLRDAGVTPELIELGRLNRAVQSLQSAGVTVTASPPRRAAEDSSGLTRAQIDRLKELATARLALTPGAAERFMRHIAAGSLSVGDSWIAERALLDVNPRVSDVATEGGTIRPPEQVQVLAFEQWALRTIDRWFKKAYPAQIDPLPPQAPPAAPARATAAAAPQPAPVKAPHRPKEDALAPLIRKARAEASDPDSAAEVFTILKTWAQEKPPRPPLIGLSNDGASITWESTAGEFGKANVRAVRSRLNRSKKARQGTARNGKAR